MATFGATAELSVPDSEIERARREIEDQLEVEVSVSGDATTPTSRTGRGSGGDAMMVTLAEERNDLLEDILDEIETGGAGGDGGGTGLSGIVAGGGAASTAVTAGTLTAGAVGGYGLGLGAVNLIDRAGGFDATENAGDRVGESLGPFRDAIAGGVARGAAPLGLPGAAIPGLARGNVDRARSDVREYGQTALQSPVPDKTVLDFIGNGNNGSMEEVSAQSLADLGRTGTSIGSAVSNGELINDENISRLESLELISDEKIRQLESATSAGSVGPDPNNEAELARVGAAQRANMFTETGTPSRISARSTGASTSELSGQQQQAIEANVTVDETIQVDASIDDLEREVDKQLQRKLDTLKRDISNELRRRLS